ncbi:DUF3071 domain-containing protein [Leucobacter sp. CSA2]|uniref:DUF3071 domain-containing protein n=1 Tax=Leucobacter edaphi TaxID=2796472 RepID=A0A934QDL1_9MICO|nr:septation protein SepH [Leucobacter edaphi]MBK0421269.1 DUF3071 domain-containing protein [Leucobacter edaphi]
MDELRFVRRDDRTLILASETGDEYRLVVDDAVLAELKHLNRREPSAAPVRPREIQALIRAGKTRAEVAEATGLEEADIERFEEPVLAERRYILERAHAVPVRTDAAGEDEEKFGEVIEQRLVSLGADASEWSSWREEEGGWKIALEFIARDVAHRAVWGFEHRTAVLSPENPDAVSLSKQGDVGDQLIPKLRAVDDREKRGRFDSAAFDTVDVAAEQAKAEAQAQAAEEAEAQAAEESEAEYERKREIDHRAIKTNEDAQDFSQTADLLDALRKRRGERDQRAGIQSGGEGGDDASAENTAPVTSVGATNASPAEPAREDRPKKPRSIWSGAGVSSEAPVPGATPLPDPEEVSKPAPSATDDAKSGERSAESERGSRKGRASIPSWDDILFGTRSDEDPAD